MGGPWWSLIERYDPFKIELAPGPVLYESASPVGNGNVGNHSLIGFEGLARHLVAFLLGGGKRYCPVCDTRVRTFLPSGTPRRRHAKCPICGSRERHRLDRIFLTERFARPPASFLHVAPEPFFVDLFRRVATRRYVSADLDHPDAMVTTDLTHLAFADGTFSAIYCSHVLEHVPDDRRALAELYRVLEPGGWALLQVPVTAEETFEDPSITDPAERERLFGQADHVRRCGLDYVERMRDAGFEARVLRASEVIDESDCRRMGVQTDRVIFFCEKGESVAPVTRD